MSKNVSKGAAALRNDRLKFKSAFVWTALLAGSVTAGCASKPSNNNNGQKPAGPDVPAGAPDEGKKAPAKPVDKDAPKQPSQTPGHPPDDQPAGNGNGNNGNGGPMGELHQQHHAPG